jgi:acyl carrier protein
VGGLGKGLGFDDLEAPRRGGRPFLLGAVSVEFCSSVAAQAPGWPPPLGKAGSPSSAAQAIDTTLNAVRGVGWSRPGRGCRGGPHHRPEGRTVSVEQRVIDIVSEHFAYDKEKITRNTTFIEDIGADSLDIVEFVMELEEEFDIQIPDDQAEKIKTVGEAVDYIDNAIKNKPQ